MAWTLETNVGGLSVGHGYMMASLGAELFCFDRWNSFNDGTVDGSVFRRSALGVWTNVFVSGRGSGRKWSADNALYTIRQFYDATRIRPYSGRYVYRSVNGAAWVQDFDVESVIAPPGVPGPRPNIETLNEGDDGYLYFAVADASANRYYFRRDILGNYSQFLPAYAAGVIYWYVNDDLIRHGGTTYWAPPGGTPVKYWTGSAWANVPDLISELSTFSGGERLFIIYNSELYMKISWNGTRVYRLLGDGSWLQEVDLPSPWESRFSSLVEGDNGILYLTVNNGANTSRMFARWGDEWVLESEYTTGGLGFGVGTSFGGRLYAADDSPADQFWARIPSDARPPNPLDPAARNGLLPQAMDVDGDGDRLYLACYDSSDRPIILRVMLPLRDTAFGSVIFSPGAGNAVNVKCPVVGQRLVAAGNFGVNNQVQVTGDSGLTWTDIDRNAWGAETAQPVLVDPDTVDEVVVALQTARFITDTEDGGATPWTVRNAAVGYGPGAMAKLPDGPELLVGNGAGNRIDYSPNYGVTLHNIVTGFLGNVAALEMV